jgi:hypothetical protein
MMSGTTAPSTIANPDDMALRLQNLSKTGRNDSLRVCP